jgi:uncharacterized protein
MPAGSPRRPHVLAPEAARAFHRRAVGLDAPFPDCPAALRHLGWVQIDPINVCGRMQDHLLRNRVAKYREGDLFRHLHGSENRPLGAAERTAFEHHLPGLGILVALETEAWPHLLATMERRSRSAGPWGGRLTPRERELAEHILRELADRGPLGAEDIDDDRTARRVWGHASLAKATLQKLFFHGRVLIAGRRGVRRLYDLPERVLPAGIRSLPRPDAEETERWRVRTLLRQRRLVSLRRADRRWAEGLTVPVEVDGCPQLDALAEDAALLEAAAAAVRPRRPGAATLLAPLDPLIYDRKLASALWNFDYTWEVYTPPARRRRGYYALPVLHGTRLAGHVDPKADRERGVLGIVGADVDPPGLAAEAVTRLARFLRLSPPPG